MGRQQVTKDPDKRLRGRQKDIERREVLALMKQRIAKKFIMYARQQIASAKKEQREAFRMADSFREQLTEVIEQRDFYRKQLENLRRLYCDAEKTIVINKALWIQYRRKVIILRWVCLIQATAILVAALRIIDLLK